MCARRARATNARQTHMKRIQMRVRVCSVVAAMALVAGLPGWAMAASAVFVVNTNGNAADASPGDGICGIAGGGCTLRAAIQEANAAAGLDTINFAIGTGLQQIAISSSRSEERR